MRKIEKDELIREGKTKKIYSISGDAYTCIIQSKDDITAGDGSKHDVILGKSVDANNTTCNVFEYLRDGDMPLSYIYRYSEDCFLSDICAMIPYEVVVRFEAHGSFLKRYPQIERGHQLISPAVEFYLKTALQSWEGYRLPVDDPLVIFREDAHALLYDPRIEIQKSTPFLILENFPLQHTLTIRQIEILALKAANLLRKGWLKLGYRLADIKMEFGFSRKTGSVVLSDVIDNDSWRLVDFNGAYLDKQIYRDGGSLEKVAGSYRIVANLSDKLRLLAPQKAYID